MRHGLCAILLLAVCSPLKGADFSNLRDDLFRDTGRISGLRIPEGDVRYQAIERLRQDASPQAVRMLGEFLVTHDVDRKLKTHALAALGEIGSIEAVDAVTRFERWSRRRYTSPPPFQFGEQDDAAVCFAPRKVTPLAQATDPHGRQWAVFRWDRFGAPALWLAMSERKGEWGEPLYLDSLKSFSLENTNDVTFRLDVSESTVRVSHDAQKRDIARRAIADDADKDGLSDLIENQLGTNPKKADSDDDGIPDGQDSNPLTPKHAAQSDLIDIRQAAFLALFATSNSRDAVVIVERSAGAAEQDPNEPLPRDHFANQEYYGHMGPVLRSKGTRPWFTNVVACEVRIESPTHATVAMSDWAGPQAGSAHEIVLKKVRGKWLVVSCRIIGIA